MTSLRIVFWLVVAFDVAVLLLFGVLGLAAAGSSHTNPLAALIVPFVLPGLVLVGAVLLFLRAPSTSGRVVAVAIAALPLVFTLAARGVTQWIARGYQDGGGGFSQFHAGPQREIEAAIARNDAAAVTRLLPSVDVNKPGISGATLLVLALRQLNDTPTQLDVLRSLLAAGADPNLGRDELPLLAAIGASRTVGPEPVRLLLAAGAKPNTRDAIGEPVYFTAGGLDLDPALMLAMLDHGADIRALGRDGRSVLSLPASLRNWKMVLLLLQRGAPWRETRSLEGLPFNAWVEGQTGFGTGDGLAEVLEFLRAAEAGGR